VAIDEQVYGPDHPEVARDLNNLGRWLQDSNRADEAEPMMGRVVEIFKTAYGPDHPKVAVSLNNQASLLQTRQPEEAERLMRQALAIDEHAYGPDHPEVARDLYNLGRLLKDVNRLNDAEPLLRRVVQIYVKFTRDTGNPHQRLQQAINSYGNLLTQMGRPQDQVLAQLSQVTGFSFGS
jgi:tetratricopeptide (TPR) repeat protein